MSKMVSASFFSTNTKANVSIDGPDACPICNRGIDPQHVVSHIDRFKSMVIMQSVFKCPFLDCNRFFITDFVKEPSNNEIYHIVDSYPKNPTKREFDSIIKAMSESFIEIYNQAKAAEDYGLTEVAGVGYRKSLEFLLKDYLIKIENRDKEIISKEFLGVCIKKYCDDKNIRDMAELASWIGNDETHYERRHEDLDVTHLKDLIDSIVSWIITNVKLKEYRSIKNKKTSQS